jgi:3-hydroxybutyryl-CoA dehydratase
MTVRIGDSASLSLEVTDDCVRRFAEIVGDSNPVHLDDDFAQGTVFGQRIAHGMIGASLISAVLGTRLPGPGTIYLGQTLSFKGPVFIGETITAEVTVVAKKPGKPIYTLQTTCRNHNGDVVIDGEAVVKFSDE